MMRLENRPMTILLCVAALTGWSGLAYADSFLHAHNHHRYRSATLHRAAAQPPAVKHDEKDRYAFLRAPSTKSRGHRHSGWQVALHLHRRTPHVGGSISKPLVADAIKYIGTNPTGRNRLWCGAFMDLILRQTGHKGGGNLALGYLHYGHRVPGPRVGAIAVMRRRGGGHVGVVTGIDTHGDPIIVSGNHNHTVAESVYPRSRIIAYVAPNS